LNNGVFLLMRLGRTKKAVSVQGFRGSGLNENPPAIRRAGLKNLASKVNERNVNLHGEP